ncbi:exodeoxyribonuclease V subunit gamma [Actinobacillus ureae]|uniref:RecBCD enzyme subunit RecC n=1 Tax=Actinobacillus ureae ATCC 25976 TaxID=887324 RepID=E8KK26_9PAST|nr:exodeoxyribonuclease V subunit gamma [Actinobacillus ureae]EFX90744.1 exodeoxyribonuclease V, gamma subunit [Actinobacillus ureae ATCC 25976]SUT87445.1 exodeoxyribonuclease V subunit gamma [Actinobacillus ureae]SUU48862.1 exodeoxyribonuclease V subunit gamma [Actinobacillus ureae]
MFTVYYSQKLSSLAEMLIHLQKANPNSNPFNTEAILVQSVGMAQWLQMQIADSIGVAGNYDFLFPTSFLWQQYRVLFPSLPKENIFKRSSVTWRLMRLIPAHLDTAEFSTLKSYLQQDARQYQLKLYQLSTKIADLFDQYLVYRPHWLVHWENNQLEAVLAEIMHSNVFKVKNEQEILANLQWQAILWNALIDDIKLDSDESVFITSHRAYLQDQYFQKLDNLTAQEKEKLPQRIFIFGISSLPATQLAVLKKLSEHCDIHLFFLNPSQEYWGDSVEDSALEKLALKQQLSETDLAALLEKQGNQLLTMWGKQGREFLAQLVEQEFDYSLEVFDPYVGETNLIKLKNAILAFNNAQTFELDEQDQSLQFHSCHSIMREVEVLHNYLLQLFEQNPALTPKDIIVMSADIDKYAPYINAVFSRFDHKDPRRIPFTLSDQKATAVDPIISSFLSLLNLKESNFNAEVLLDLLDVNAIRSRFRIQSDDIYTLRHWIKEVGIRAGLTIEQSQWQNYNSWQNGLTRLLLGTSLKEENGIWQDSIGFNESYGLTSELVGYLCHYLEKLSEWQQFIQASHSLDLWQQKLTELISDFYLDDTETFDSLSMLQTTLQSVLEKIENARFEDEISVEILALLLQENLNTQQNSLQFLAGKVSFCTLLPMRAIPFKVVCLLGMNEADFPRQHSVNSFDLMQYAPKKGDRARRDDDRYLFLEALLSAQEIFYVSYVGQSVTDNKVRLPSVLVAQLLDYISEHLSESAQQILDDKDTANFMLKRHPMTVFSPRNFSYPHISYDKEWLKLFEQNAVQPNFLNGQLQSDSPTEINLNELISYITNPIKYFFNRQLGIYFNYNEESIEESEKFTLNALDNYQLRTKLLTVDEEQSQNLLYQEQLKGNLPSAKFAKLSETALENSIKTMRNEISPYLKQSDILTVEQYFPIGSNKIKLYGNIQQLFDDGIVFWKVSSLKDKDIIRFWIYYLVTQVQNNSIRLKYIVRNGEDTQIFQFNSITQQQAQEQLAIYIEDYLNSFQALRWGISAGLDDYFAKIEDVENIEEYCCQKVFKLLEDNSFEASYLQRVLVQSSELNYSVIHHTTKQWFTLMQDSKPHNNKKEN